MYIMGMELRTKKVCSLCGVTVKTSDDRITHLKQAHDIEMYQKASELFQ